jgi:predicted lipase
MTRKLNNFELYEIDGETYSLEEIKGFIEASKNTAFLKRQNNALKMRCSKYCLENHELRKKIADMEFTSRLLGEPMTESDIAEEQFIENGEAHYEKTWNIACEGDDF